MFRFWYNFRNQRYVWWLITMHELDLLVGAENMRRRRAQDYLARNIARFNKRRAF